MKRFILSLATLLLFYPSPISAQTKDNSFITIVNPLRIAPYNQNPLDSIGSEYQQVERRALPATWLATYDLLNKPEAVTLFKSFDSKQELGVLMEISPKLAEDSGVKYHKSDSWHRAESLFLVGYIQSDRLKLIDTVFKKFKADFGFYPTSVGAWWIDGYSLEYMKNKYNIIANLALADQFSTDSYQVWGSYWSTPFYPSKYDEGEPASSLDSKIDLVNLEWAPRDPLNSYHDSVHSTQDYYTINLPLDYFSKLVNLYSNPNKNEFGQITLGLEGDLSPTSYQNQYSKWLDVIQQFQMQGVQVTNMKQFGGWYRSHFPNLSPPQIIESDDLLGSPVKSIWYQSPIFRIGLTIDHKSNLAKVIDFRTYSSDFFDPYYFSPVRTIDLFENIPSLTNGQDNPNEIFNISSSPIDSIQGDNRDFKITFGDNKSLELTDDKITLTNFNIDNLPINFKNPKLFKINNENNSLSLMPTDKWLVDVNGFPLIDYIIEKPNFLRQRRGVVELVTTLGIILIGYLIFFKTLKRLVIKRILLMLPLVFLLVGSFYYLFLVNHRYFVNQSEVDALTKLSYLPHGKIVVYDRECVNCSWDTPFKPAVLVNKRSYVSDITGMPIIYDSLTFTTSSRAEGKSHLRSLGAKYIYLVRYGDYHEDLPFSPGDYGVKKIYENATSQVWQIES